MKANGLPPVSDSNFDWKESRFRILHINITGRTSHGTEFNARMHQMDEHHDLICVNDRFFSRAIVHIILEGYELIVRQDRCAGRKCCGKAAFDLSKSHNEWLLFRIMKMRNAFGCWWLNALERMSLARSC